jgi:hypothetical protein
MEPLQAMAMPAAGVLVGITSSNSWQAGTQGAPVLLAYVATNSTERLVLLSLQTAPRAREVMGLAARPSNFEDMPYGVVVEVYLAKPLSAGETVYVSLAQAGATTYYPPQPIDDLK